MQQVLAYRWKTIPERGVVRSREPFTFWWAQPYLWNGEARVVKFCNLYTGRLRQVPA